MDNTITSKVDGSVIDATWFNDLISAFGDGDIVPRSAGVPTANGGNVGSSTYPFGQLFATTGHFICGNVIMHYDFDGAAPIGEGWMLMDGRQITQANYDAEHGTGHFAEYIGSTPLLNLYMPDMVNSGTGRYPVGANATQSGASAITPVGNTSHEVNLSHTHTIGTGSGTQVGDSGPSYESINTSSALSSSQSIQPESIKLKFYMRII